MTEPIASTVRELISCYKTHPKSNYSTRRYNSRQSYDSNFRRIERDYGGSLLHQIKQEDLIKWREEAKADGPHASHSLMVMLRIVFRFGAALQSSECQRLAAIVSLMHVSPVKVKKEMITAEQVTALRAMAHKRGAHSIALAQAFQFECKLTQLRVLGEWLPESEPGSSDVCARLKKWLSGLRWSDIDEELILTVTADRKIDLKNCPMVMEELAHIGYPLPVSGPVIVDEASGLPYLPQQFCREWRAAADAVGIPKSICNMDSRPRASTPTEVAAENKRQRIALLAAVDGLRAGASSASRAAAYKAVCEALGR